MKNKTNRFETSSLKRVKPTHSTGISSLIPIFLLIFGTFGFIPKPAIAQAQNVSATIHDMPGWQPLGVNVNGTVTFGGVQGWYQLSSCNNIEVVLVKLYNHNDYAVKAAWKSWVVTNDNQKLADTNSQGPMAVKDSVLIPANSQVTGDCSGNNPGLIYKLSDFGTDKLNFRDFITTGFDFAVLYTAAATQH